MTASPPSSSRDLSPGAPHVFHALDGLRGIAAIVIAIYHVPFLWPQDIPAGVFYESYLSVDFFFVLSGFVLAYSYGRRLEADLSADQFILMRLIRLYPLYFCAFLISVGVECLALRHGLVSAATAIARVTFAAAFFPAPFGVSLYPMNFPAWSLFYEVVANRAFAMTGKRLTTRVLTIIVAVAALTLLYAVSSRSLGFGTMEGAMNAGSQWPGIGAGFARVAYSFFAGVLVFRLWRVQGRQIVLPPFVLSAVLILILVAPPSGAYQTAFDLLATLLVFPAIVWLGANSVSRPRERGLFVFLGRISYGVYVLQAPIYALITLLLGHKELNLVRAASCVLFVMFVAAVAEKYFDRPTRRRLTGLLVA